MSFLDRSRLKSSPAVLAIGLIALLLIGAIWATALGLTQKEHQQLLADEISKNANLVRAQDERATRSLQVLDQVLLFLRADYARNGVAPASLNEYLAAMQVDRRYVGIVSLIDAQGNVLSTTSPTSPPNFADRDYFKAHAADPSDQLSIGQPIIGRLTGQWILSLTRRVNRADGSFGGVIFMALNPAFLAQNYEKAEQGLNNTQALIGLDGITRARRNGEKISFGENVSASQLFKEIPKARSGHYTGVAASDGQRRLASYQVMNGYPMVTVVASSLKDIDALAKQRGTLHRAAAGVGTGLICALAALSITMILRRKRQLDSITASERRFRLLFENSLDAVISTHPDGRVLDANPAACQLFGRDATQWSRVNNSHLFDASDDRATSLLHQLTEEGTLLGEVRMMRADGQAVETEISATRSNDDEHLCSMIIRDITERKRAEDQIRTLAFYDSLTDLPNRRLLMDRLQMALLTGQRQQHLAALMFIDLDHFKHLNDSLGHHRGDQLLQLVAQRLLTCIRESDTCARLGGDEFVVLLVNLGNQPLEASRQAEVIGQKVLAALGQPYPLEPITYHLTASLGITLLGGTEIENMEEPLKRADLAMYQAKASGRNAVRFFDPKIQADMAARLALEASLREALERQQFVLHYQPQVDGAGRVTGAEVLVRWIHPQRGVVSPAEFIPLAEETGLILPLGQWVLETACHQLAGWAGHTDLGQLTVSVNVSELQFRQADFVDQVVAALTDSGARADLLKLELTEGLLVTEFDDVIAKMSALKARGVGFSLDDFGTGYSSLAYLMRLPLDQLKIDQGFVRDILVDPNDAAIARMVIVLAQSLGLSVIAEGVETTAQRDMLATQGCHAYQGYLFSRPLDIGSFEMWVAQQV
jgi:diguanylate cyclase (GGDEF)-like protein/PAS domain S-box-containing protein